MEIITIGIDTGAKGGITKMYKGMALVSYMMPTVKELVRGKNRNVADFRALLGLFRKIDEYMYPVKCIIEKVHAMPRDGGVGAFTFGRNYQAPIDAAMAIGWDVELVIPQTWKREILSEYPKKLCDNDEKLRSIRYCEEKHAYHSLIPPRAKKPRDGIADSLCLAEYGYRKALKEVQL